MNTFFKIILLFIIGIAVVSCSKDDNGNAPLRDYTEQYVKDIANIETFMKTHSMTVVNNPGSTDDQDVTFTIIPTGGTQTSIWDQTMYPILSREVTVKQKDVDVTYKIYYIKLREGAGPNSKSPCNVDRVLTAYKGEYIYTNTETVGSVTTSTIKSEEFETSVNPQSYFNLTGVIRGWSEIFPQFRTGNYAGNPDGTISYTDFGSGIMFIPSGLAYFGNPTGGIPAYSPLVFNIKLYEVERVDQDGDGIFSYQEDLNGDGYMLRLEEGVVNPDDTDGDEIPDFLDTDDDGDFFTTKSETSYVHPNDVLETVRYYPFNGVSVDDPLTPFVDETKGVPDCAGNFTNPTRLRKYRDAACH
ncbi:FKBP-type peptidyl-prolyl cis-trans isomerase [Flavobacterium sp.]|jgi:hypothetical protein|uniref:FKBP-type peptidyl-prolyl cis-trans isomerase n=1 Tax=Flavobacterium sp. TaxID=239 RepID=UPI0037BE8AE5